MLRRTWPLALALAALVGCEGGEAPTDTAAPATGETAAPATGETATPAPAETGTTPEASADETAPAAETGSVQTVSLTEDEIAEIKKLPEAEAEVALKQKVCPISGENLGGMGKPIKVEANGKTAYLCCEGCQKDFEKDPKAALAKLGLDK